MNVNVSTFVAAALLLAVRLPVAKSQTPSEHVPASFFGMRVNSPNVNWPKMEIGALANGSQAAWVYVEPNAPVNGAHTYNWSVLDRWVFTAQAHAVDYLWSNSFVPRWAVADPSTCTYTLLGQPENNACTGMVANIADWDAFINALVARYRGQIKTYELWSKPDDPKAWTGTVADMVLLTAHLHDTIRDTDNCANISSPSSNGNHAVFMDNYWASGGTTDVDIVGLHGEPSATRLGSIASPLSGDVRFLMTKYGLSGKPLWNTEARPDRSMTRDQLDAFVTVNYIINWSKGISRLYYGLDINHASGLPSGSEVKAYQQVYAWLHDSVMSTCSISGPANIYETVYTCSLSHDAIRKLIVWNSRGPSEFSIPSGYRTYVDLAGVTRAIVGKTVAIGIKPILLEP